MLTILVKENSLLVHNKNIFLYLSWTGLLYYRSKTKKYLLELTLKTAYKSVQFT